MHDLVLPLAKGQFTHHPTVDILDNFQDKQMLKIYFKCYTTDIISSHGAECIYYKQILEIPILKII